jgi:AraC-like DNA-binding protein
MWSHSGETPLGSEIFAATVYPQLLVNLDADVLTHEYCDGRIHATGGIAVQGLLCRPVRIDRAHKRWICGVQFSAVGLSGFVEGLVSRFVDGLMDARLIWPEAGTLRDRLLAERDNEARLETLEHFLVACRQPAQPDFDRVGRAVELLEQGLPVGAVRSALGMSQRALHAGLERHVGVRPKVFSAIARTHRARETAATRSSWSDHAFASGFADQAHMVREYQRLSGGPPNGFLTSSEEPHSGEMSRSERG